MSRTPDMVQDSMLRLVHSGWSLPVAPDSYFAGRFRPMAQEIALLETSMEALLPEVDPRTAPNLLPDYERVLGPDPCQRDAAGLSTSARATIAWQRWTQPGGVYANWFIAAGAAIGETVTIQEFPPCALGTWELGAMMLTPANEQCAIAVTLPTRTVTYFEVDESELGPTSLGDFTSSLMECVFRQGLPLHVASYFSYTG